MSSTSGAAAAAAPVIVLDADSLALVRSDQENSANSAGGGGVTNNRGRRSTPSVATTAEIASSVGSVVVRPTEAFLKSFTILRDTVLSDVNTGIEDTAALVANTESHINNDTIHNVLNWGVTFRDPVVRPSRFASLVGKATKNKIGGSNSDKTRLYVDSVDEDGVFGLSRIREGDYLKSINGRGVGPSLFSQDLVLQRMQDCLDRDGVLSVATKNREDDTSDILVHATIVKPRPNMTYKELGMVVWVWGYLCIKEIDKNSIFHHTVLKETDNIVLINEITCDDMTAEQFARVITALPREVTITVLRRKERVTGKFG